MTTFKAKDKKRDYCPNIKTLDAKHKERVNYYKEQKNSIPKKQLEIVKLQNKLVDIEDIPDNYMRLIDINDKIRDIEKEISTIEDGKDETEYYLKTGDLLYNYYDSKHNSTQRRVKNKRTIAGKTITDFFLNKTKIHKPNEEISMSKVERLQNMSIAGLHKMYLLKVDNTFVNDKSIQDNDMNQCTQCSSKLVLHLSEGKMICDKCGYEETILIDSDKPSYKEPPKEVQFFSYKRINHFREWLAQCQAKETTQIPVELYNKILLEIKKERITNMAVLTISKMRIILKKLKFNKFYEHIPHIINKLNGIPPPIISRKIEDKLIRMFMEIQIPFYKHCPPDRKNFLSYAYVLHKFCQLLSMDELLIRFPLLKSRQKLYLQDLVWEKICKELRWEFIPSL